MHTIDKLLIATSLVLYLLGRLCDDLNWHAWPGIQPDELDGISVAGLAACVILITIRRLREENGLRTLFWESQKRFVIPWGLTVLLCILTFNIFGCKSQPVQVASQTPSSTPVQVTSSIDISMPGCIEYCFVLLLSNFIYSSICNEKGELAYLIVFEIVLFAEIIYDGTLLMTFIDNLTEKPKEYSILFVSITIAWEILVMDLIFRAVFEDREKLEKRLQLEEMVISHYEKSFPDQERPQTGQMFQINAELQDEVAPNKQSSNHKLQVAI